MQAPNLPGRREPSVARASLGSAGLSVTSCFLLVAVSARLERGELTDTIAALFIVGLAAFAGLLGFVLTRDPDRYGGRWL